MLKIAKYILYPLYLLSNLVENRIQEVENEVKRYNKAHILNKKEDRIINWRIE